MLCCIGFVAAGCSSAPGLYAELGAGVKLDRTTSAVLRPDCHEVDGATADGPRSCGGDNPTAHFAVGYEFPGRRGRCELVHFSHYFDGGADRETHMDQVRCVRRWGGR